MPAPYETIAADLRALAAAAAPGDRLPSGRELADRYGVALATAQRALAAVRDEGLAVAGPRGYTVTGAAVVDVAALAARVDALEAELTAVRARLAQLEGA